MDKVNVKLFRVQSDSTVITPALSFENTGRFLSSLIDILIISCTHCWKLLQPYFSVPLLKWQKSACCRSHRNYFKLPKSQEQSLLLDLILLPALQQNIITINPPGSECLRQWWRIILDWSIFHCVCQNRLIIYDWSTWFICPYGMCLMFSILVPLQSAINLKYFLLQFRQQHWAQRIQLLQLKHERCSSVFMLNSW